VRAVHQEHVDAARRHGGGGEVPLRLCSLNVPRQPRAIEVGHGKRAVDAANASRCQVRVRLGVESVHESIL